MTEEDTLFKVLESGGSDKELLVLDEINALDIKIDEVAKKTEEKITAVSDKIDGVSEGLKKKLELDLQIDPEAIRGAKGDKGDKGEAGKDGVDGKNGIDGTHGLDGKDGLNGQDGRDGVDGKDGESAPKVSLKKVEDDIQELRQRTQLLNQIATMGQRTATSSGSGTPATSVTDETTYGVTPAVGTNTNYARQDHTHGSPATPLTTASGVYSPSVTVETNLDATTTATQAQYLRVGSVVTVSGRFTANPTLTATATSFEISLPVASNIGAVSDCSGVAFCGAISGQGAEITGVVANDTAQIKWVAADITIQTWSYTFSYRII